MGQREPFIEMMAPAASVALAEARRGQIYRDAMEMRDLAKRAMEFTLPGPRFDLDLAERQIQRIRAIAGTGLESREDEG